MRSAASLALLLLAVLAARSVAAQGSVTVRADDPMYLDADRLIDAGLVDTVIVGQRPYSRMGLAMIARQAQRRMAVMATRHEQVSIQDRNAEERLLRGLARELSTAWGVNAPGGMPDIRMELLHSLRVEALVTDAPTRAVPPNGLGSSEADLNAFTDYHQGLRLVSGGNVAVESEHSIEFPFGLTVQARPRLWIHDERRDGVGRGATLELPSASARLVKGNVALTVGREYTVWPQAEGAAQFFSENAPALDMIRVASNTPFVLPSLLRWFGPIAGTIQIADLGASVNHSHSRLVAYKLSAAPVSGLELGARYENHFGGSGSPPASATDRIIDLVPFLDVFRHHVDSTDIESDKLLGLDARLRLRNAGNVTLFGEFSLEDFDLHRLRSIFTEDAAYSTGMIIPSLVLPSLSARLLYHTLGLRFYEHHQLTDGIASHRLLLGDDLGRDATGFTALLRWQGAGNLSLSGDLAHEERRNDEYLGSYASPGRQGLVFERVSTQPREQRTRGVVGARWLSSDGHVLIEARGGAERTTNFNFRIGTPSTHGVGTIAATLFP
jgi:hypothetical protein